MDTMIQQILAACKAEGVVLRVVEGNLQVSFDDELSDRLLDLLRTNKPLLVEFLAEQQTRATAAPVSGEIERLPRDGRPLLLS